jgi:hypothetical protein
LASTNQATTNQVTTNQVTTILGSTNQTTILGSTNQSSTNQAATTPAPSCKPTYVLWDFNKDPNGTTINGIVAGTYLDDTPAILGVGENVGCLHDYPIPGRLHIKTRYIYTTCKGVQTNRPNYYVQANPNFVWIPANSSMIDSRIIWMGTKAVPLAAARVNLNMTFANGTVVNYWQLGKIVNQTGMYYGNADDDTETLITSGYEVLICMV